MSLLIDPALVVDRVFRRTLPPPPDETNAGPRFRRQHVGDPRRRQQGQLVEWENPASAGRGSERQVFDLASLDPAQNGSEGFGVLRSAERHGPIEPMLRARSNRDDQRVIGDFLTGGEDRGAVAGEDRL